MLIIRESQMLAFGKEMRHRFVQRMRQRLRGAALSADSYDPGLTELIERGIGRAAGFGLTREGEVERFLDYVLAYGLDFGADRRTAWAGAILRTKEVSPAWKLNRLDECDLFAERESRSEDA